jgi:hypothetical protein
MSTRQTVGELRAAVATMGNRKWSIAPHLRDRDPLPQFPTGGDFHGHPRASEVAELDLRKLVRRPIANPMLAARNLQMEFILQELVILPGVDWRDRWGGNWLTTVQIQNPCLSCWAFATAALVETMVRIEHGVWAKRSEGDLRDGWGGPTGENWIVRDGFAPCEHGAGVTGALDWVAEHGIADPDCYAWSPADELYAPTADRSGRTVRIGRYQELGSLDDAKKWLDAVGPVITGMNAYDDFKAYRGPEVYHLSPNATGRAGHYVLIVGFDDTRQCWIIRNSWGSGWGVGGYGFVGYGEANIDDLAKLGLVHTNPDPWSKRRLHAGNIFESGNGAEHRNFEMIRGDAPRVRQLWRDGSDPFTWHAAATLDNPDDFAAGAGCVGQPAATSTTYNRNFEIVYWELSGRLRYWSMNQTVNAWHDGGQFGPTDCQGFPALMQSNYGAPGNLEVIFRRKGGRLEHWWRDGAPAFAWHDGGAITDGVKMSGPSLVQANVGNRGNFYVVCVTDWGTMQLWWRDNDNGGTWMRGEVFGGQVGETPVCMIQGEFGTTDEKSIGNFELCVAVGGQVQHWWRDNSKLSTEVPRADYATPGMSDGVSQLVKSSRILSTNDRVTRMDVAALLSDESGSNVPSLAHAALDNAVLSSPPIKRWHQTAVFGHDVKHVWGLVQGSFGFNLDVIVETTNGALQHYSRNGDGWHEGVVIDV